MSWGYSKGFVLEHDSTLKRRIDCKDCIYYESDDKSCLKRPLYLPVDGYNSWRTCKFFEMDSSTSHYDEKLAQYRRIHSCNLFKPDLKLGQKITNAELSQIFQCTKKGRIRSSHTTNTLILVSECSQSLYRDKWIEGVLHFTGMGKNGDQDIHGTQNDILARSSTNGVGVHLFEVMEEGKYTYFGRVELSDKPYIKKQPGEDGIIRTVWIFPLRPVSKKNVKKQDMFVAKDMNVCQKKGKNVDAKSNATHVKDAVKKRTGKTSRKIRHKKFGEGTIVEKKNSFIIVRFSSVGKKQLNLQVCLDNGLIEFV